MGRPRRKTSAQAEDLFKVIAIRARSEWIGWLHQAAAHCRTDVSKLLDAAVVEYLKARGFDDPPPPRF